MKVYNKEKTEILENYDLDKGYLVDDYIDVPEIPAIEEQSHLEVIKVYPNGGKDVVKVIDVPGREYQPARQDNIYIYIPYTEEQLEESYLQKLRVLRENECFPYINRGELWYNTLTQEQIKELNDWYVAWLNVTHTRIIPTKPEWLN